MQRPTDTAPVLRGKLKVLVACECSGRVRDALIARGHDAMSCDLKPTEQPGPHHQGDVRDVLYDGWDAMIAFPDCTFLCVSGLHWNHRRPGRAQKTEEAVEFFRLLHDAPIDRIGLENPIGCISKRIRKPDQIIQPWQFGHNASKATCLWLKNLPRLVIDPAKACPPRHVCRACGAPAKFLGCDVCGSTQLAARWGNQTDSGQNRLGPSVTRAAERARTYQGIADAMADQWGSLP